MCDSLLWRVDKLVFPPCYLKIINENSGTEPEVIFFILGASGLEANRKRKPPSVGSGR